MTPDRPVNRRRFPKGPTMSQTRELIHPRDEIMRTMERIYRYRMTTTSGGNISILDDDGSIWITPARLDKGNLRRDDIVRVRPDGVHEGPHRPSSEFPFHRAIYQRAARPPRDRPRPSGRPGGLQHLPEGARHERPAPGSEDLRDGRVRPLCLARQRGSSGENIAETFATGTDCVILENHGVVIGGAGLQQAFERFETLEFAAKTLIKASILGQARTLDRGRDDPRAAAGSAPALRSRAGHEPRKRPPPPALRVRPPGLPAAPDDQHPGGLLRQARRRRLPDHPPPG